MNHAQAINTAATKILAARESMIADAEGRRVRQAASSTSEVARVLGLSIPQWHAWVKGQKDPGALRLIDWLARWTAAGMPALQLTTTADGVEIGRRRE